MHSIYYNSRPQMRTHILNEYQYCLMNCLAAKSLGNSGILAKNAASQGPIKPFFPGFVCFELGGLEGFCFDLLCFCPCQCTTSIK